MAMIFGGPGGDFDVTYAAWADILDLAEKYGWTPTGTEPPEGSAEASNWSGTYYSSDGQRISDRDALELGSAIEAFLSGEPPTTEAPATVDPERASFDDFLAQASELVGAPHRVPGGTTADGKAWLNEDEGRAFLGRLATFCKAGGFRLW